MLKDLRAIFLRDLSSVIREVESYPSDQSLWHHTPGTTNSGGQLARHLAGNLRHFIGLTLGGVAYERNREDEFTNRGLSRIEVIEELKEAHKAVATTLEHLPLAKLSDPFPIDLQGKRFTTLQFLLHLSAHLAYHLGQIDYHRRQQQADSKPVGTMGFDSLRAIPDAAAKTTSTSAASSAAATFVNLDQAFARIPQPWSPVVIGELNGQEVKAVKLSGSFEWHSHQHEDELFYVHKGAFRMEFRDRNVDVRPGEYLIVPRGVEHRPVADAGAEVMLFEPVGIVRTGD